MFDLDEMMSRQLWGKSSKANAPENQNPDWQDGYACGQDDSFQSITDDDGVGQDWWEKYLSYGKPEPGDPRWGLWQNWKRGFHNGRLQKTLARDC